MKTVHVWIVLFSAIVGITNPTAAADQPRLISYQGVLNSASGVPIAGSVSFAFAIYEAATGGAALWSESQTLSVVNGVFNVQLGAVSSLPLSLFARDVLYLGIRAGADQEMVPRQRMTSTPFSMRAEAIKNKLSLHGNVQVGPTNETVRIDFPIYDAIEPPKVRLLLRGIQTGTTPSVPSLVQIYVDGALKTDIIGDQNARGPSMFGEGLALVDTGQVPVKVAVGDYAPALSKAIGFAITKVRLYVQKGQPWGGTVCTIVRFTYEDGSVGEAPEWCRTQNSGYTMYVDHLSPMPEKRVETVDVRAKQDGDVQAYVAFAGHAFASIWGVDGIAVWNTGELDLSSVANWATGEHSIEAKAFGSSPGTLVYLVLVN